MSLDLKDLISGQNGLELMVDGTSPIIIDPGSKVNINDTWISFHECCVFIDNQLVFRYDSTNRVLYVSMTEALYEGVSDKIEKSKPEGLWIELCGYLHTTFGIFNKVERIQPLGDQKPYFTEEFYILPQYHFGLGRFT